jgi:hypothetical protein
MTFQWKCPFAVNAHLLKINDLQFQELACIFFQRFDRYAAQSAAVA